MKILSSNDIRQADAATILSQGITSIDLMERASTRCAEWIASRFARTTEVLIFCGPGNNGGDGAALSRILHTQGYRVMIVLPEDEHKFSGDLKKNIERLPSEILIKRDLATLDLSKFEVIIDALFGTGLSRSPEGFYREAIEQINNSGRYILSIDVPSGLPEYPHIPGPGDVIVKADHTLTFHSAPLSFMFPSVYQYCGSFTILDIGLDEKFIEGCESVHYYITKDELSHHLRVKGKFDHKGNNGHGLLASGSFGKAGAAILSGKAAIHGGIGLLTIASPECNHIPVQTSVHEAMYQRSGETSLEGSIELSAFDAIAIGPGIGSEKSVVQTLKSLVQNTQIPLILDADALNILGENKTWLAFLPALSVLTPHPKEFSRLTGIKYGSDYEQFEAAKEFSKKNKVILVLKGAHTVVCSPDGKAYFNSTGNPGLAKGGSGDALTGLILAMMAQGYTPLVAAILSVYLHGKAADIALEGSSEESVTPSDVIASFGKAFTFLKS